MPDSQHAFTAVERRTVSSLAAVVGLRMVGLFLIVPVLALHAFEFADATPLMIGVALGIYGLTQAALQIPFGFASDKWGRKPVIGIGIVIFAVGCVIAATADTLAGIVLGRAVQGAGAIAAAVFALVGDLTRDSQRNKAMAVMGVSIGSAFTLSLILAPILDSKFGLGGLFWIAFALAGAGLLLLVFVVPDPPRNSAASAEPWNLRSVIFDLNLIRLFSGSFSLHAALTALFVAFPLALVESVQIEHSHIWKYYVPIFILSFVGMVPLIRVSARGSRSLAVMIIAALILAAGSVSMIFGIQSSILLLFGFWLFFVGFNTLEALLPSATIRIAPERLRGTAMGAFNTCTFSGAFVGGIAGGLLYGLFGAQGVFAFCALTVALWSLFVATLKTPGT